MIGGLKASSLVDWPWFAQLKDVTYLQVGLDLLYLPTCSLDRPSQPITSTESYEQAPIPLKSLAIHQKQGSHFKESLKGCKCQS